MEISKFTIGRVKEVLGKRSREELNEMAGDWVGFDEDTEDLTDDELREKLVEALEDCCDSNAIRNTLVNTYDFEKLDKDFELVFDFDDEDEEYQYYLSLYLECDFDSLSGENYDHYGLTVFSLGGKEYAIGTEDEADEAAEAYIKDTVWAFNASFIASHIGHGELEEMIQGFQEAKCEDANEVILNMIESMGDWDDFVGSAIGADGRGHFMSSYDGHENEIETADGELLYIYRTN